MNLAKLLLLLTLLVGGCDTYKGQIKHDPNHHDQKTSEQK